MIAAIASDDRGAGILAHRQQAVGGNDSILQHLQCHKAVIVGRFGVLENGGKLAQMAAAQQMRNVGKGTCGEQGQPLRFNTQKGPTIQLDQLYMVAGHQLIYGFIRAEGKHRAIDEISQDSSPVFRLSGNFGLSD